MPRAAKDSEDEGRRTRTIGGSILSVDSPLRRSTRNKQSINQDDESSPESITSDPTGTSVRITRRKTTTAEYPLSDNTRSLRSRKNSNASDATDFTDNECPGDMKKRITRRSVTADQLVGTPNKTRLRRSLRAGSESKTISPLVVRTTRRTRASSVDIEDNNEPPKDKSLSMKISTPFKARNRASALPSEPAVIEESEISLKQVRNNEENDINNTCASNDVSVDSNKSSISQIKFDESHINEHIHVGDIPIEDAMKLHENDFESTSNNSSISPSKSKSNHELKEKLITEIGDKTVMDLPKIVLYKTEAPSQKSPGNKENEKSNTIMFDEKLKTFHSNNSVSRRRSANFAVIKKVQLQDRLNKSVDDHLLTTADNQSTSVLSSSSDLSTAKSSESQTIVESLINTNNVSITIGSTNESIILVDENINTNHHTESVNDNSNDETIHIESKSRRNSLKMSSDEILRNNSVSEIDATIDNIVIEGITYSADDIAKDVTTGRSKSSIILAATENSATSYSNGSERIDEDDENSLSLNGRNMRNKTQISQSSIEKSPEPIAKISDETTPITYINTDEIVNESIVEIVKNNEEKEETPRNKKRSSLFGRHESTPKVFQMPKSSNTNDEDKNLYNNDDDDIETDVENLFHDISAEEWKAKHAKQSVIDECSNADDERDEMNNQDEIFSEKISRKIAHKGRFPKVQDVSDYDSDDTVIMQTKNELIKYSGTECSSIITEEPMDVNDDDDDDDTEIDQENILNNKSLVMNRKSLSKYLNENHQSNDKYTDEVKRQNENISFFPECESLKKADFIPQKVQFTTSTNINEIPTDTNLIKNTSRKSLNNKYEDLKKENNKLKRRTIEKMDLTKYRESPKKCISTAKIELHIDENKNDDAKNKESSIKSSADHKNQLSNNSSREKTTFENLIDDETEEDDERLDHNEDKQRRKSGENFETNNDNSANTESDSNDENNQIGITPEFLLDTSTSENSSNDESSASIDTDVAREFNLNGDSILHYSDDDVAGDDCRASESEASIDDDDDDDDNDMKDFIVDDDDDDDDEEEDDDDNDDGDKDIEDVRRDEKNDTKNVSKFELLVEANKPNKSTDERDVDIEIKSKSVESSDEDEQEMDKNHSTKITVVDSPRRSSSEKVESTVSLNSSTPKIQKRLSESTSVTTPKVTSVNKSINSNKSVQNKSHSKAKSVPESKEITNSALKSINNATTKIDNTIVKKGSANIIMMNADNHKLPRSESLDGASLNYSMQIASTESPEMKLLMKEKLNESLPTLKLQRRSLKASRRSSLMDLKEGLDEQNEESTEESKITDVQRDNEMKKNIKIPADDILEYSKITKANVLSSIEDQNIGKKKRKKNLKNNESETLMFKQTEEKKIKKKKIEKEVVESVTKNTNDTNKPHEMKSKSKIKSNHHSVSIDTAKKSKAQSVIIDDNAIQILKKANKKISKNSAVSPEEKNYLKPVAINENPVPSKKYNVKRLSEDVIENLSDIPAQPNKRRKLNRQVLPSKTMFDEKDMQPDNLTIEDVGYISVSGSGGTSQFTVVNLKKIASKRSKKSSAAWTFRERMLARNNYQPVSAYLMYQQKLKASCKDKR